jgi:hypothetical protein
MLEVLMLTATKTHSSKNALQLKMCKRKKKNITKLLEHRFSSTMIALNFHLLHFYAFATIADLPFLVLIFLALELLAMKFHN